METMTTIARMSAFAVAATLAVSLSAQEGQPEGGQPEAVLQQADPMNQFRPQTGTVKVGSIAEAKLGEGWRWLDGDNGRSFLRQLGNRPDSSTLGVALPPDFDQSGIFAVYSYVEDGHIEDLETPDWDELLESMKEGAKEDSKQRVEQGLESVELLGWAEPPQFDAASKKMFWAERLQFGGSEGETLNYNVRLLGRNGHMVINGVGGIEQLRAVDAYNKELLQVTDFVEGKRYSDFDPSIDKVAAYGIGALVAGKLAAKLGIFALLLKNIKLVLIGIVAIGGGIWKFVTGRRKAEPGVREVADDGAAS